MRKSKAIALAALATLTAAGIAAMFQLKPLVLGHQPASRQQRQVVPIQPVAVDVTNGNSHQLQAVGSTVTSAPMSLLEQAEAHLRMIMSQATDLGSVGAGSATEHLITAPTSSGGSCLVAQSADDGPSGSCLDTPSLFTDRPLAYLVQSDGGPDPTGINYLRVVGAAAPNVDGIVIELSSGDKEALSISSAGAFEYDEPLSRIHAGDRPSTLIASHGGAVIGTFPVS
jgi:hypothetical protein